MLLRGARAQLSPAKAQADRNSPTRSGRSLRLVRSLLLEDDLLRCHLGPRGRPDAYLMPKTTPSAMHRSLPDLEAAREADLMDRARGGRSVSPRVHAQIISCPVPTATPLAYARPPPRRSGGGGGSNLMCVTERARASPVGASPESGELRVRLSAHKCYHKCVRIYLLHTLLPPRYYEPSTMSAVLP